MVTPSYLALCALAGLGGLWRVRRARAAGAGRILGTAVAALVALLAVAFLAGWVLAARGARGDVVFLHMRLFAWGLFCATPVFLAGVAALAWSTARRVSWAAAAGAVLLLLVALQAFVLEPRWLEVSRVRLASPKLTRPVTIVVIADLQTDDVGEWERGVLARAMEERPDVVLLAGDYVHEQFDGAAREVQARRFQALLRDVALRGALGAFAVAGNVDEPGWERMFEGTGVAAFGSRTTVEVGEVSVTALGLDDSFDRALRVAPIHRFHVVFGHGPDFALGDVEADLLVAGHTHGGQVRLPGIGPIITLSRVPRSWAAGVTALPRGRTLVVSRGIGMERGEAPRLRFLCRPEVVVIRVEPG